MLPVPGRLLSDEASERVYKSVVQPYMFEGATRAAVPRLVVVGGQPGCGKTGAVLSAAADLSRDARGVALINGDELRPFHPDYRRLVEQDRATAADRTGPDVGAWVERAIRDAAASGVHAVIETTMRQPAVVTNTIKAFQEAGHQAQLRALVVHPEQSMQAIYARFARALTEPDSLPRFTLASYHEAALTKFPETLRAVEALRVPVQLLSRGGKVLHEALPGSMSASLKLESLRAAPLARSDVQALSLGWAHLRTTLDRPGFPEAVRAGIRSEQARFELQHVKRSRGLDR